MDGEDIPVSERVTHGTDAHAASPDEDPEQHIGPEIADPWDDPEQDDWATTGQHDGTIG